MKKILCAANKIASKLKNKGHQVFFTGGFVRDRIMNRNVYDIDIVTDASLEKLRSILTVVHQVGKKFEIAVVTEDGFTFEVARFRKDSKYTDGRRPNFVSNGTMQTDAKRRDFTINGLYINPFSNQIIDLVDGIKDIKLKIIKTIGNPHEKLLEDRLRALRGLRFATVLGFSIEKNTSLAIKNTKIFPWISPERVREEIYKANSCNCFIPFMQKLYGFGLIENIFPKEIFISEKDLLSFKKIEALDIPIILKIAAVFKDGSPTNVAHVLCSSNIEKEYVNMYESLRNTIKKDLSKVGFLHTMNKPWYLPCLQLALWDVSLTDPKLSKKFEQIARQHTHDIKNIILKNHPITGKMLKKKNIPSGPIYSKIIKQAWVEKIHNNLSYEEMLQKIDKLILNAQEAGAE